MMGKLRWLSNTGVEDFCEAITYITDGLNQTRLSRVNFNFFYAATKRGYLDSAWVVVWPSAAQQLRPWGYSAAGQDMKQTKFLGC